MDSEILKKYNIPVPRYTSYPPANFFSDKLTEECYIRAIEESNHSLSNNISFYIHIPFCHRICYYCGCNSLPITSRENIRDYVEAIKTELRLLISKLDKRRKVSQIHYGGGTPTVLSHLDLGEINNIILSSFDTIENPEIAIECNPDALDMEYWHGLIKAGFTRISIGIQDFDVNVLKAVNRRASRERMEDVFSVLNGAGISTNIDFIYGLPLQTPESFLNSIERAVSLSPERIVTFSYAHVPWVNKLMLKLEERGLPEANIKKEIFDTAKDYMLRNGYTAIGMDHFVRKEDELYMAYQSGGLHRNFQGYCTKRTTAQVYGIGVSAISQLSGCYAQNTKEVSAYIESISQGKLPIIKGYEFLERDILAKEIIDMLMCNDRIEWEGISRTTNLSIEQVRQIFVDKADALDELRRDNIIELREDALEVTKEGKVFIRNVASVFDHFYTKDNPYSKPI